MEVMAKLKEEYLDQGSKVPASAFGALAEKYSECSSGKKGGDLGWFPCGKMEYVFAAGKFCIYALFRGKFQEVAFDMAEGECSDVFKGSNGYHIILCTGRKA